LLRFKKKYYLSENLKFNYLGIFQSLKLRILMGKILSISLKLNFTPNTLGCYGLNQRISFFLMTSIFLAKNKIKRKT